MTLSIFIRACFCIELIFIVAMLCFDIINRWIQHKYKQSIFEVIITIIIAVFCSNFNLITAYLMKTIYGKLFSLALIFVFAVALNHLWNRMIDLFQSKVQKLHQGANDTQNQLRKWIHRK